ncbi:MAG TPA: hypothetical protein VIP46_02700 [Pyrinomonadaceae bacterium]
MRKRKCRVCDNVTAPTGEADTTSGRLVCCTRCLEILRAEAPEVEGGSSPALEFDLRAYRRTGLSLRDYFVSPVAA